MSAFRVLSPYRFNPLGAHVDHQGGAVLARTLEARTELLARPNGERALRLEAELDEGAERLECALGEVPEAPRWARYAAAAAAALDARRGPLIGIDGRVSGSMIAAGLSSSASFLLAVITALARANGLVLPPAELVDLVREVEHDHLELANGIQDQLSIVHGRAGALALLDVDRVEASHVPDPPEASNVRWVLCFSGVRRELVGSGFNTRVSECAAAAGALHPGARRLCDVPLAARTPVAIDALPDPLGRRARHVYGEIERVAEGAAAWGAGDIARFGALVNASCASSIELYGSGSEWLVALQQIALATPGVLGSRFSGGGYGGCLVMLADASRAEAVGAAVLDAYLERYPGMRDRARTFDAGEGGTLRVESIEDVHEPLAPPPGANAPP